MLNNYANIKYIFFEKLNGVNSTTVGASDTLIVAVFLSDKINFEFLLKSRYKCIEIIVYIYRKKTILNSHSKSSIYEKSRRGKACRNHQEGSTYKASSIYPVTILYYGPIIEAVTHRHLATLSVSLRTILWTGFFKRF